MDQMTGAMAALPMTELRKSVLGLAVLAVGPQMPGFLVEDDAEDEEYQDRQHDGHQPVQVVLGWCTWTVESQPGVQFLAAHSAQDHQPIGDHHVLALGEE